MIAALQKTADENYQKKQFVNNKVEEKSSMNPTNKDWKDTLDELNSKKE